MDLKKLEYFICVYECKSIHKASKALFVSQQAISKSIQTLEQTYATILFTRTPTGLISTPFADFYYKRAIKLVKHAELMQHQIDEYLALSPLAFQVAFAQGILEIVGVQSLLSFLKKYPKYQVSHRETTSKEAIALVENDAALLSFSARPTLPNDLIFEPFNTQAIYFACNINHPLAKRDSVCLEELQGETFAMFTEDFYIRQLMRLNEQEMGLSLHCGFETREHSTLQQALSNPQYCSFSLFELSERMPEYIVPIPIENLPHHLEIGFSYKAINKTNKGLKAFIAHYRSITQ